MSARVPPPRPSESPSTNTTLPVKAIATPNQTRLPMCSRKRNAAPRGTQSDSVVTRTALEATLV
jgi:hypothetical protein